jgi:hypothetical protein
MMLHGKLSGGYWGYMWGHKVDISEHFDDLMTYLESGRSRVAASILHSVFRRLKSF